MTEAPATASPPPRRRADAKRNVVRILDAAVEALAEDTETSMAEIARRAGVVRATIYVHYPTREALLDAVTERALSEATRVIEAAEPERGDAAAALRRVLAATWQTLGRYHALIAVNTQQTPEQLQAAHHPVLAALEPLIRRGQAEGTFRDDVPPAWHLSMLIALVHAASGEVRAGRLPAGDAERALAGTVLGALANRTTHE